MGNGVPGRHETGFKLVPVFIGIVGSEGKKFTNVSEEAARALIRTLLAEPGTIAVSGHCHLGGIDIWTEEEAAKLGLETRIFPPKSRQWSAYKARNMAIAQQSDIVYCLTVNKLPASYVGMKFKTCYHCGTAEHVKSGGCWTTKYARSLGKQGITLVISNE